MTTNTVDTTTTALPATAAERTLAGIWSGLLSRPEIGREDNFFAVGGHSMLVVRLVNQMRQAFATDIPLNLVFENPTLAGAAAEIEKILVEEINAMSDDEVCQ